MRIAASFVLCSFAAFAQPAYDLVLRGGHVIDGKAKLSAVRDIAIRDGKIAEVTHPSGCAEVEIGCAGAPRCHQRSGEPRQQPAAWPSLRLSLAPR